MKRLILLLFTSLPVIGQSPVTEKNSSEINASELYQTYCASCHGINMEGAQHSPLRKADWLYGRDRVRIYRSIMNGISNTDMIPWSQLFNSDQGYALTDYILASQDLSPDVSRTYPKHLVTTDYVIKVEPLATEGFTSSPWSIEFVDERRALISQRRGGLLWMIDGKLNPEPIEGTPKPLQQGDGGMYDIAIDPDYGANGWIYFSYVHSLGDPNTREDPAMTRVVRGRIKDHQWMDEEVVFSLPDSEHVTRGTRWGSRLLFDRDGYLYFSIGDLGRNDEVQDPTKPGGKIYRIFPDGSIPPDNPYVGYPDAIEAIYTIGNRNMQGIDQHPDTGAIWATEHGPMGGDELNILGLGKNYGWPVISWGINYNGSKVTELTEQEGMEQPIKYWTPSPALSAVEFYSGDLFKKWKNNILVGALAFEEIKRLRVGEAKVLSEEVILKTYGRVRDIKTGPDGAIYVVLNNSHAVLRLTPGN